MTQDDLQIELILVEDQIGIARRNQDNSREIVMAATRAILHLERIRSRAAGDGIAWPPPVEHKRPGRQVRSF